MLKQGDNRVGSLRDSDLLLAAAGVSRQHALLRWDDDGVWVEDLGSKNGTLINGARVQRGALRVGDAVCFGPVALVLESMDADDGISAFPLAAPSEAPARPARRRAQRTSTEHSELAPGAWLGALARVAELIASGDAEDIPVALDVVRTATGAPSAALLSWVSGELAVEHVAGDAALGSSFDVAAAALAKLFADPDGPEKLHSAKLAEDPPVMAAVAPGGAGEGAALIVQGDFPSAASCGPFLTAALRLLRRQPRPPADKTTSQLRRPVPELTFPADHVPGRTPAMLGLYHQLHHLVSGDLPVLITGETGVGKEHVARILHLSSPRKAGPFVAVNCAAIPTELLEAELFGIEKGIATGVEAREGKMQNARGGVIFLDEVGDMSPALQAKLLRAVQEREVHPVGARRPVQLDVRILSATNTDLAERIVEGRFRQDLYFRLAGYTLRVPALRERRGDIPGLVQHFMTVHAAAIGKRLRGISRKTLQMLVDSPWPGNVRELENEVRRVVYLCNEGELVTSSLLSEALQAAAADVVPELVVARSDLNLAAHVAELERHLIAHALERTHENVAAAARLLGLSRYGLSLKLRRLGMGGPDQPSRSVTK